MFYVFVALIIGGAGSNTGSVIGGAVFASLLFEGPNFVRRVVTELVQVGSAPNTFFDAVGPLAGLDPTPLLAYTLSDVNVSALRLVLLGLVLIYLIQNRPDGLLGHRKEVASSVDLSERTGGDGR
jgi:branched-chain amino acid transport system permease protein